MAREDADWNENSFGFIIDLPFVADEGKILPWGQDLNYVVHLRLGLETPKNKLKIGDPTLPLR
jgi:hypothetical protein